MTTNKLISELDLKIYSTGKDREIENYYIGDLLSWVMGRAGSDSCWLTIMSNVNVCAVAKLIDSCCVILCEGVVPDQLLVEKMQEESIYLLGTKLTAYELTKKIVEFQCRLK